MGIVKKEWNDAQLKKPALKKRYELCLLDLGDKIISGWWNGMAWEGLHYKGQQVKRWKYAI